MKGPSSRQRGCPISTKLQLSGSNKNLNLGPRYGLTPRLTGKLTVCRNVTLMLVCLDSTVELAVKQSPVGNDVNTEDEKSSLLRAVT
jgi:hypothetical protein